MESSEDDAGNTTKNINLILDIQDIPTQYFCCAGVSFCVYFNKIIKEIKE